ncbi:DNA-binding response OmpR family regulator [Sphingomonas naasensis]|uniref:response regulator n=1 Tax=Sphingomonas naasensis TaxID=1344951 RepID=UPI00141BAFDD|nr:response regulator [Sphingomonas naasensis]NIJ18667.1 DNA-binding response OmpR family regulator [Sphingomonas naasensis]
MLLVEDEALIGMMAHAVLEEQGATVDWVQTDREAYRAIEANARRLDLLITDINLREGTTGFDISRFARRLSPTLPVIYVSGEEREALVGFAVAGATFLYKPVPEMLLLRTVEQAVTTGLAGPPQPGVLSGTAR